jgi:hypothetical protein
LASYSIGNLSNESTNVTPENSNNPGYDNLTVPRLSKSRSSDGQHHQQKFKITYVASSESLDDYGKIDVMGGSVAKKPSQQSSTIPRTSPKQLPRQLAKLQAQDSQFSVQTQETESLDRLANNGNEPKIKSVASTESLDDYGKIDILGGKKKDKAG